MHVYLRMYNTLKRFGNAFNPLGWREFDRSLNGNLLLQNNFVRPGWAQFYILNCLFLGAFTKLRKATISFVMSACLSVCPFFRLSARNHSASTGRIFMKFDI